MTQTIARVPDNAQARRRVEKEVVYEEARAFFGLIKWWRRLSSRTIGEELHLEVVALGEFDRMFVNGVEVEIPEQARAALR